MSVGHHIKTPTFSLIVPTRKRTEGLRRLLDSLLATTSRPDELEIVLIVDEDDTDTLAFHEERLNLYRVVLPPGQTMGALNMAGYEAATGRYVMLLNDDVIARTPGWDERVLECLRRFPDDIALIHTNDLIFGPALCTFPIVSRTFCELVGGICPREYVRYRIDDHIGDLFQLLAVLGEHRIIWMPDVVFEHTNYVEKKGQPRIYTSIPEILDVDAALFDEQFPKRKELAIRLREYIDRQTRRHCAESWRRTMEEVHDPFSLRFPSRLRVESGQPFRSSANTRVTIGVVTSRSDGSDFRRCLRSIKATATNCELMVLDHGRLEGFHFPRELNRLAELARTDHVILLHDKVCVKPGWLDGLLRAMTPGVGIVTPVQLSSDGKTAYTGVAFHPDGSGHHSHLLMTPHETIPVLSVLNPVMLIDRTHWRQRFFSEEYQKYFFDLDLGLRAWEEGLRVVCTPEARVTITDRTGRFLPFSRWIDEECFEEDRKQFVARWVRSGRYQRLVQETWQNISALQELLQLCDHPEVEKEKAVSVPILRYALQQRGDIPPPRRPFSILLKQTLRTILRQVKRALRGDFRLVRNPPPNPTRAARW